MPAPVLAAPPPGLLLRAGKNLAPALPPGEVADRGRKSGLSPAGATPGSFCLGKNASGLAALGGSEAAKCERGLPRAGCAPSLAPGPVFPTSKLCGLNREVVWPPLSQLLRHKEAAATAYVSLLWESRAPCSPVRAP